VFRSRLWHDRDFLAFWASQVLGDSGLAVTTLALPSVAILALHASAFQVGILAALSMAAWAVLPIPVGVLADHWRRRPVLVGSAAGRAMVLLTVPVAALAGHLTLAQLYVVALLEGGLAVVWNLASTTYLPAVVGKENLLDANSKVFASRSAASLGGPGVGGFLVQLVGPALTLWASSLAFVLATFAVAAGRRPEIVARGDVEVTGFIARVAEGFRFIGSSVMLRALILYLAVANIAGAAYLALELVYLYRAVHLSPATVGVGFAFEGAASFIGAAVAAGIGRRIGLPATLIGTALMFSVAIAGLPLASLGQPLLVFSIAMLLFGFANVVFDVNQVSWRMSITPDHLQGRMTASARMIVLGVEPIGAFAGGLAASTVGLVPSIIAAGVLGGVATLCLMPALPGLAAYSKELARAS
jgi:MFS family permease